MDVSFVAQGAWADAERRLAAQFRLDLILAEGRLLELLVEEFQQSDFSPEDILAEFEDSPDRVVEFGRRWYADCLRHDYGEEWNSEEGNQQQGNPLPKAAGIAQGFLVSYTLLFLYAKSNPDALLDYIKRRRIPNAKRVTKDVMRVFNAIGS